MPRQLLKVQVSLQDRSALARDRYVNTFHLSNEPDVSPDFVDIVASLEQFYGTAIASYLSPHLSNTLSTVRIYDLALPLETPPVYTAALALGTAGTSAIPNEVAVCLSYHAVPQPGPIKRQSWRGRIYIGPLSTAALNTAAVDAAPTTVDSRPNNTFRTALLTGAASLASSFLSAGNVQWVVASKVQQALYPIDNFTVDDAWDIQRSRGDRPTNATPSGPLVGRIHDAIAWPVR